MSDDFVDLMLRKAKEEPEEVKPQKQIVPEKDDEPEEQRELSEDEKKDVEDFTKTLMEDLQKR